MAKMSWIVVEPWRLAKYYLMVAVILNINHWPFSFVLGSLNWWMMKLYYWLCGQNSSILGIKGVVAQGQSDRFACDRSGVRFLPTPLLLNGTLSSHMMPKSFLKQSYLVTWCSLAASHYQTRTDTLFCEGDIRIFTFFRNQLPLLNRESERQVQFHVSCFYLFWKDSGALSIIRKWPSDSRDLPPYSSLWLTSNQFNSLTAEAFSLWYVNFLVINIEFTKIISSYSFKLP